MQKCGKKSGGTADYMIPNKRRKKQQQIWERICFYIINAKLRSQEA